MQKVKLNKYYWLIIPLLFLLYSAPGALDYVFHYPDEKYYTDAVLQMMDKNDCFTPYKADGSPRFLKPIFTYWVLMGSYKMLGVSKFSSRLLFWLAGALLVIIVYFMSKSITRNKKTAVTAAFITASNPLVLISASRSIPDILLVLFLTVSAWGFLEIMITEKPKSKYYWMAYLGAAFAFETKGLPAAALTGLSILFLILNPWKKKKIKHLVHPASLLISIAVALSWFAIMYIEHGSAYFSSFYEDQVGDRVASKTLQVITNALLGIVNLLLFSLPWIVIAFSYPKKLKASVLSSDNKSKAVFGFIFSWIIMIIIMSAAVFKFYDRYILPVIPLLSIFFAWSLVKLDCRFRKTFFKFFLALVILTFSVNILYTCFILTDKILIAGIVVSTVLLSLYFSGVFKNISTEVLLANTIMLLYFNGFVLLYPLLMPNQGEQLVENLKSAGISEKKDKIYVYGNIRTASNIRIHSHDKYNVVSMDTVYTMPEGQDHFLVFSNKEKKYLKLKNYEIFSESEEWPRVPVKEFPGFLESPVATLKRNGKHYYIAKPK